MTPSKEGKFIAKTVGGFTVVYFENGGVYEGNFLAN
jgi:hypothetical protein